MRSNCLLVASLVFWAIAPASAQLMLSGNENKIDLSSGGQQVLPDAPPDTLTILDFSAFPPAVSHIDNIRNSVIGPPSNIAIAPDESIALVASSLVLDSQSETGHAPDTVIHILDLEADPPAVIGEVHAGRQPSGMSISRDGRFALVANRADGTITHLKLDGKKVTVAGTIPVCEPEDSLSDVAIAPDGRMAVASVNMAGYLALLEIDGDAITVSDRKFSVAGKPYRCVISPDGALALTAGSGEGYPDADALTVIDLKSNPPKTVDYVTIGSGPESIEISPGGQWVAAVLMDGSNLAPDDPMKTTHGALVILERRGNTFEQVQTLPCGAIPEGVAFSPDGQYLVVQAHPDRELWLYRLDGKKWEDTGHRIPVPGMPSSLRIADK